MLVEQSVAFLDIKRWLEKQISAIDKLGDAEALLGRKDGFIEILSTIQDNYKKNVVELQNELKAGFESYQWQLKNQKMEDSAYSHEKVRAYLATLDYIKKNNK